MHPLLRRTLEGLLAWCTLLLVAASPLQAQGGKQALRRVQLDSGWEFRQSDPAVATQATGWLPAQVPGDVHLDLIRNKVIPSPFYRDNESKLQWIQEAAWEYRSSFVADADLLHHNHVDLVLEGLDAAAEVSLNGTKVLSADNMFRVWRLDAKPFLHEGTNQILVLFPSATKAASAAAASDKWRAETQTPEKTYVRKAAYEYGWDWGPTFVTSGIWRPAKLEAWDDARISSVYIRQRDVTASVAHLSVELDVNTSESPRVDVGVSMMAPGGQVRDFKQEVTLSPGPNHISIPIEISQPALWFPAGYGEHPIYKFTSTVTKGAFVEDQISSQAGLRSVVLRRDLDKWGRSFEFVVNGIPVFAKGAAVIPFDSFPNRVTDQQYRRVLQSAVDANMNMVRHWGGGYYETDDFYNICDELGLMVWQDFMFGNEWQPGTYAFRENVEKEVEDQVRRLRNHPSIVLWCGNNETEISWDWERMKAVTAHLSSETRRRMWQDYLTLFSGVIQQAVARLDPETPYWPSSPSADYEDLSNTFQSGDVHDWSVWHGRAPFSEYETQTARFMTEFGFQSFPEMRTIMEFTSPEDRTSIFTPVMLAHQKNDEGNAIIHDYMLRYYNEPKDFASFLYASQVLQAEGVKIGAEYLRRGRPRAMGSLYWQLNDCWPVASWSSIDYYGRWKALQYYARRFYSPLLVSPHVEDGSLAVYVVSDKTQPTDAVVTLTIETFQGKPVLTIQQHVSVDPLGSRAYIKLPLESLQKENVDLSQLFASAKLNVQGQDVSSNIIYLEPTKQIVLPPALIKTTLAKSEKGYTLTLTSPVLARSVLISFGGLDASSSDNYFDLLPGQPVSVTITTTASEQELRRSLNTMSLSDAFVPENKAAVIPAVPANPDWK